MIYRKFGNTGLKVSALGFGAGEIGDFAVSENEDVYKRQFLILELLMD